MGEYGYATERPHYHVALFNSHRSDEEIITKTWQLGHIHVGDLTPASAGYLCGYVTKKMTSKDDIRLNGRYPEFARMSNRPGIGAAAMDIIGESLFNKHVVKQIDLDGDVPMSIKHGRKSFPLGPYLRQKLREYVGMPDEFRSQKIWEYSFELHEMLRDALKDPSNRNKSTQTLLYEMDKIKILQIETRHKIHEKVRTL